MPPLSASDIQLLTQLGFMAAGRAQVQQSQRIFGALALLRPQHAFPHIGMACAWMNANQPDQAVQHLSHIHLQPGQEADMLDAFRALALQLAGHAQQSTNLLKQVVERTAECPDSSARRMALSMLGQPPDALSPFLQSQGPL